MRRFLLIVILFFNLSAFAENFSYRTQVSHNVLSALISSFPGLYDINGFKNNTNHQYLSSFESSFFEALTHNQYIHPSGRNFTSKEKQNIYEKLLKTSDSYLRNQHHLHLEYEKFESQTYAHIQRNKILRLQVSIELEQLNAKLSNFHDRIKLVADVSELHKMGYPMEIMASVLDFLVANQNFKKDDTRDNQLLVRDKNGDVFRLPLAFAIHEVNRLEKNEVYKYFLEKGHARKVGRHGILLSPKAIVSEVFDIITDHIDAISRQDLGDPKSLTSASRYLSNLKKTPSRELSALLHALGTDLITLKPLFDYFEAQGYKTYQDLVSDKIVKIKEFTRGFDFNSLSCRILFQ